jgi:outer membrane lipoprotein-sorting protein
MLSKKWLVLIALPIVVSLSLACGGGSKTSNEGIKIEQPGGNTGAPSLTPGVAPPTLAAVPTIAGSPVSADEVSALAGNFGKVKSFKATISQSGGASASLTGSVEYQQPDKIRVVVGSGATGQEIICVGEAFYFKQGNNPWQKAPPGAANCRGNLGPADPKALADGINAAAADKTLKKGGQDTVAGKRCQIYAQALNNGSTFEMCVADGLPLRIVTKAGTASATIMFSDIDKDFDIKAPI